MALTVTGITLSGGIKIISQTIANDLTYDPTWSGGSFTVTGNTVTTTGQFASVLYALRQTLGKIYFEFTSIQAGSDGYGCYIGVQRVPTRAGNYHDGSGYNGNGGQGRSLAPMITGTTYRILVDLDAQTVSFDGAAPQVIFGSGQLYFAVYDGTSSSTGSGSINWGTGPFVYSLPAGAVPAGNA